MLVRIRFAAVARYRQEPDVNLQPRQQFRLLGTELFVGQDSLVAQLAEAGDRVEDIGLVDRVAAGSIAG